MKLFTLPDQSKMQVEVMLHETVVNRVSPGMEARATFKALPGEFVEGSCTDGLQHAPFGPKSRNVHGDRLFRGPDQTQEHAAGASA